MVVVVVVVVVVGVVVIIIVVVAGVVFIVVVFVFVILLFCCLLVVFLLSCCFLFSCCLVFLSCCLVVLLSRCLVVLLSSCCCCLAIPTPFDQLVFTCYLLPVIPEMLTEWANRVQKNNSSIVLNKNKAFCLVFIPGSGPTNLFLIFIPRQFLANTQKQTDLIVEGSMHLIKHLYIYILKCLQLIFSPRHLRCWVVNWVFT